MPGKQVKDLPTIGGGGLNKNTQILCSNNGVDMGKLQVGDIVDSLIDGFSYMIKFSSGVIIQGGRLNCPEDGTQIITFSYPLVDSTYRFIFVSVIYDSNPGGTNSGPTIGIFDAGYRSTTGFKVWANSSFIPNGTLVPFFWQCVGKWK